MSQVRNCDYLTNVVQFNEIYTVSFNLKETPMFNRLAFTFSQPLLLFSKILQAQGEMYA